MLPSPLSINIIFAAALHDIPSRFGDYESIVQNLVQFDDDGTDRVEGPLACVGGGVWNLCVTLKTQ